MPDVIRCPHCTKAAQIPEGAQGKKVRCPSCLQTFVIPAPAGFPTPFGEGAPGEGGQAGDVPPQDASPSGRPRAFISHATPDWPFITREILPVLTKSGIDTW